MARNLKSTSSWYCDAYAVSTGRTSQTVVFSPGNAHWILSCYTSNTMAQVWHIGYDIYDGGWTSRFLKFENGTTPVLGFASKNATITFDDGNNGYQLVNNGGYNQMTLSRASGSTDWSYAFQSITHAG